jgi:hypothetical protein
MLRLTWQNGVSSTTVWLWLHLELILSTQMVSQAVHEAHSAAVCSSASCNVNLKLNRPLPFSLVRCQVCYLLFSDRFVIRSLFDSLLYCVQFNVVQSSCACVYVEYWVGSRKNQPTLDRGVRELSLSNTPSCHNSLRLVGCPTDATYSVCT